MDENLRQMIEDNHKLLQENLELTKDHTKKIERINRYIRRQVLWKIMYWGGFIVISLGAYYYSRPFVEKAVDGYDTLQEQISNTSDALERPTNFIQNLLN
jgi:uncharacterized protein (DUF2164 family)